MDSPNDWAHLYLPTAAAESTAVSTVPGPARPVHTIPDGRVGKSARRRTTRASRRAPTTLLNTDPTNFRAMVQQFTGAPAGRYACPAEPVISFGFGDRIQQQQAPAVSLGQYGQFRGQGYEGAVMLPGGNASDGFVQTSNNVSSAASASTTGFFFDGNRSGGYFL